MKITNLLKITSSLKTRFISNPLVIKIYLKNSVMKKQNTKI